MKTFKLIVTYSGCLLFMITMFSSTVFANQAIINNDYLNVRTGPGTTFDKIKQVYENEVYPIIQTQDDWVEIELDGHSGWVISEYITIEQEDQEVENTKTISTPSSIKDGFISIQHDNTHIRKGPSLKDKIILFADKTDTFKIVSEDDDWYEVQLKKGTGFLFKKLIEQQVLQTDPLHNKTIVIDAGHGGSDVGSISISGRYEKNFTLQTAYALKEKLTMFGANVVLTRGYDRYIRLDSRATLANYHVADAFISIHYNSFPDLSNVSGIDTYYYDDHDQALAQSIQQEVISETYANDRGINFGDFQVLRQNFQPAVLLELGFISNDKEEQLLLTSKYQEKVVNGIINGLSKYFSY